MYHMLRAHARDMHVYMLVRMRSAQS